MSNSVLIGVTPEENVTILIDCQQAERSNRERIRGFREHFFGRLHSRLQKRGQRGFEIDFREGRFGLGEVVRLDEEVELRLRAELTKVVGFGLRQSEIDVRRHKSGQILDFGLR